MTAKRAGRAVLDAGAIQFSSEIAQMQKEFPLKCNGKIYLCLKQLIIDAVLYGVPLPKKFHALFTKIVPSHVDLFKMEECFVVKQEPRRDYRYE